MWFSSNFLLVMTIYYVNAAISVKWKWISSYKLLSTFFKQSNLNDDTWKHQLKCCKSNTLHSCIIVIDDSYWYVDIWNEVNWLKTLKLSTLPFEFKFYSYSSN